MKSARHAVTGVLIGVALGGIGAVAGRALYDRSYGSEPLRLRFANESSNGLREVRLRAGDSVIEQRTLGSGDWVDLVRSPARAGGQATISNRSQSLCYRATVPTNLDRVTGGALHIVLRPDGNLHLSALVDGPEAVDVPFAATLSDESCPDGSGE